MEQMQKQAQLVGTEILNTQVTKVELKYSLKKFFLMMVVLLNLKL